jgi:hypothetical protein
VPTEIEKISLKAGPAAIVILAFFCVTMWARQIPLTGRVLAYDPIVDMVTLMNLTDVDSVEFIILDTGRAGKDRFVKVEVYAYDRRPLPDDAFDGKLEVQFRAKRSKNCDEKKPNILKGEELATESGKFLLTAAYRDATPAVPGPLPCYVARTDK